ncbi:glycosyltransferase, partial [Shewanella sp. c952]|uniref:glycosyltransferase n=1 Tax=Shewanella sp. c952 TaxID=2815913 RepID=UPI001C7D3B20
DYILELLNSILEDILLSAFAYEILIIDDGSKDITYDKVKDFVLKNPSIVLNAMFLDNVGISNNLNRIVKESNGEFIRLCASDDLIVAGSTNILINEFEPSNYCVVGDGNVINTVGNDISSSLVDFHSGNKNFLLSSQNIKNEIIRNYSFAGPCLLIRKTFFNFYSYDSESKIDDYDFFVTLVTLTTSNTVKFIDESVCKYRVHKTNTSKSRDVNTRLENQMSM